mmetsp:Transcript_27632/g.49859  ORF Transcript_27632/g.49859 Transcript_27632/m.49859 type:complete len:160 (+) Transcript_27632:2523-3002(+)
MSQAIEPKLTLTIINSFVINSSQFLNQFSATVHSRISDLSRQLQRLEVQASLLEYKLNSIPAIASPPPPKPAPPQPTTSQAAEPQAQQAATTTPGAPIQPPQAQPVEEPPKPAGPVIPEELKMYVRMIGVGVPRPAVKHKMMADGHDPDKLDEICPEVA